MCSKGYNFVERFIRILWNPRWTTRYSKWTTGVQHGPRWESPAWSNRKLSSKSRSFFEDANVSQLTITNIRVVTARLASRALVRTNRILTRAWRTASSQITLVNIWRVKGNVDSRLNVTRWETQTCQVLLTSTIGSTVPSEASRAFAVVTSNGIDALRIQNAVVGSIQAFIDVCWKWNFQPTARWINTHIKITFWKNAASC